MSYHDFEPGSFAGKLGQRIYLKALDDRRGFRYDQIGIDDDEIWTEIFEHIGREAITSPEVTALVAAARALADDYATIGRNYHNTPVYEALRAASPRSQRRSRVNERRLQHRPLHLHRD